MGTALVYATNKLAEYCIKYDTPFPHGGLSFVLTEEMHFEDVGEYDPETEEVRISDDFSELWDLDQETTKKALSNLVAHEVYHHMANLGLFDRKKWTPPWEEVWANRFAAKASQVSNQSFRKCLVKLYTEHQDKVFPPPQPVVDLIRRQEPEKYWKMFGNEQK